MASETIALEWARIPAASLKAERSELTQMLTHDTLNANFAFA
jgi:hypothetical protein